MSPRRRFYTSVIVMMGVAGGGWMLGNLLAAVPEYTLWDRAWFLTLTLLNIYMAELNLGNLRNEKAV